MDSRLTVGWVQVVAERQTDRQHKVHTDSAAVRQQNPSPALGRLSWETRLGKAALCARPLLHFYSTSVKFRKSGGVL